MNVFTFFSGIMLILLSSFHAIYGVRSVFREVFLLNIPEYVKTSLLIPWHQLTFVLFALGIAQIIASYHQRLKSISILVLIILLGNLGVFFLLAYMRKDSHILSTSIPQYVLFGIIIILTILGILRRRPD